MTVILLCLIALIVLSGALYLVMCREALVAAVWFRVFPPRSWYPPEAAEAPEPVDEPSKTAPFFSGAGVPVVPGVHPDGCCCEVRVSELMADFDWHAAEYEMRKTK